MGRKLTADEIRKLVEEKMSVEEGLVSTQEIISSGAIPRLKGYVVQPGKVSDSVFGGEGNYKDSSGNEAEFENEPLMTKTDVPLRLMVRTERVSTHDKVRGEIPFKDQVLAFNHNYMRKLLEECLGTSQFEVDGLEDNSVVIGAENLRQIPIEMVLRAYAAKSSTTTSLFHHYFVLGEREFCGHKLPEGLIPNGKLPYLMDTPSTKSRDHDESVSPAELYKRRLCTPEQYEEIRDDAMIAFGIIRLYCKPLGIKPVDTKTEHGINKKGQIVAQDEIWTMDSSRFWLEDDYEDQLRRLEAGEIKELAPKSYSKQFARDFSKGDEGYTDQQRVEIAIRYVEGIQILTGKRFEPDLRSREERVVTGLQRVVEELAA